MSTPRSPPDATDTPETIGHALKSAAARLANLTDTPRLDAEVLLLRVLGRDRAYLRAWPERALLPEQAERFRDLLRQREAGMPIAYLVGEREFWSRSFIARPGVLIPRPETELLIELALAAIPENVPADILDLGTGTGIIAVTLAAERPLARVTATDISPEALGIARENAAQHNVARIRFLRGSWFDPLPAGERFDLVASNPPYIAEEDPHLRRGDPRFEPKIALSSGPEGLDDLAAIAREARHRLNPGGRLLLEHGYDQADALAGILAGFGYAEIVHHRDLQGHRRATAASWPHPVQPNRLSESAMPNAPIPLPRHLVNQLLHYAQSSPDLEVCGLVGGNNSAPGFCYPVRNAADDPERRYSLDPEEHIAALRAMRDRGEELFAIFHSHPAAPAEPSATDLELAAYPDALYLIVSLNTKGVLELRGFRIDEEKRAVEVELLLEPGVA